MSSDASGIPLASYDFYHCIDLGEGVVTPGFKEIIPAQQPVHQQIAIRDLTGKRVLDIGCRDGLFSFAAERQGGDVTGIDNDLSKAAVEFLIPHFRSRVKMRQANIYDFTVSPEERFDFVIFAGVLYHLRFPMFALKRIADVMKPGGTLLIETATLLSHNEHPFLFTPAPAESPYDPTSVTFFNYAGLSATLKSLGFEDIQCTNILVGKQDSFPSWDAFFNSEFRHLAETTDVVIGRGTFTCKLTSSAENGLSEYWYGTHDLHSDPGAMERFRTQWNLVSPYEKDR